MMLNYLPFRQYPFIGVVVRRRLCISAVALIVTTSWAHSFMFDSRRSRIGQFGGENSARQSANNPADDS
jgi:hypothetical protein